MRFKIKKFLSIILLSLVLVVSSPLYALAPSDGVLAEAPSAPEAPSTSPAHEASSAPESSPAPEASSAPEASPAPNSDPSPSPSSSPDPSQQASADSNSDGSSSAGDPSATNSGNGPDSTNDSSITTDNNTQTDTTNTVDIANNVDAAAITGDNSASYNTGGASSVITGGANLGVVVSTDTNSTQLVSNGTCCGGPVSATNSDNGSGSTNNAAVTTTNTSDTSVNNNANIQTELVALSLSGGNDASYNTGGDSEIITGDANAVATIITDANAVTMGIYEFDVNGNQNGDIVLTQDPANCVNCSAAQNVSATNSDNGAGSTNDATASSTTTTTETINNEGDIVNNINLEANTGDNQASYNTNGDSSVQTGDANVVANVINTLNTVVDGVIYTVNIFGDLVGNIILPDQNSQADSGCDNCCGGDVLASNTNNGADSTNTTTASVSSTSTTTQTNNATINNNLNLDANSGGNQTSFNTGGDNLVETGDVSVDANVINVANVNVAGTACDSPVYMVFINDPNGNWQGQIAGAGPGTYFYTSDGLIYVVGENGDLIAVNSGNGAGSTSTSTATQSSDTNITQNNTGTITNNINIDANTGDNQASYNTNGDSSVKTGDANIFDSG